MFKYLGIFIVAIATAMIPVTAWTDAEWSTYATVRFVQDDYSSCSGVMIARGYMLTAAHCDGPGLRTNNGPAEVIVKDTAKDLLFLKVVENCPCASISDEPLKFADEVMAIGFPNALLKAGSPGKYYGHFNDPNYPQFHGFSVFSMVTEGGYSGGGIFNKYGDLVGLVSAGSKSLTIGSSQQMIKDVLNGRQ